MHVLLKSKCTELLVYCYNSWISLPIRVDAHLVSRPCVCSEVQRVVLEAQTWAVLAVELTKPAAVFLDGRVLFHQQRFRDILLIVPNHHVPLKLPTRRRVVTLPGY